MVSPGKTARGQRHAELAVRFAAVHYGIEPCGSTEGCIRGKMGYLIGQLAVYRNLTSRFNLICSPLPRSLMAEKVLRS